MNTEKTPLDVILSRASAIATVIIALVFVLKYRPRK